MFFLCSLFFNWKVDHKNSIKSKSFLLLNSANCRLRQSDDKNKQGVNLATELHVISKKSFQCLDEITSKEVTA